jgi:hypothetical protein
MARKGRDGGGADSFLDKERGDALGGTDRGLGKETTKGGSAPYPAGPNRNGCWVLFFHKQTLL